jgi:hypothetical protein
MMARYFMHLRDSTEDVLDEEGFRSTLEAVPALALRGARDCIAADARSGRIDLTCRIDVHDVRGIVVHSLSFADAVEIVAG